MADPDTLAELTDIAMDLARLLHRTIAEESAADSARVARGQPPQSSALVARLITLYMRLARCIRQIVALRATLGPAAAFTPAQASAIEVKKQQLRALAAEAIDIAAEAPKSDALETDPSETDPSETEHPTRAQLHDIRERLADPAIDQPTAIATVATLIRDVRAALPTPTAAAPQPPDPDLAELATRITTLAPQPFPLARATRPPPHPAPIPDG